MSGLHLLGVTVGLPGRRFFAPTTLAVPAGVVATLLGPSGIGKSSLLAFVGGHLAPPLESSGRVILEGRDVTALPPEARRIGLMFQDAALFPHLSVGANLAFGLAARIRGRAARRAAMAAALAAAGLAGQEGRDPATLSGGERLRVALMRTLVAEPAAVLLDEPFAALDPATRARVRAFALCHLRDRGVPVLMVTHDPGDAEAAAGPVLRLAPGQPSE
jgi:putative thiamine transport system ATP-binding protein